MGNPDRRLTVSATRLIFFFVRKRHGREVIDTLKIKKMIFSGPAV